MRKINKIVSAVVLVCFLFNTAIQDLAFSQTVNFKTNVDKLATPSHFDDLVGIQHKDIGRIELEFEALLMKGSLPAVEHNAKERTIFSPADMRFFFHEPKQIAGHTAIMVRIKDKYGLRTYYALFNAQRDDKGGFPVNVYTEEEYKRFEASGALAKAAALQRLNTKSVDAQAIDGYKEHEVYDREVIEWAHEQGLARESEDMRIDIFPYMAIIATAAGFDQSLVTDIMASKKFYIVKLTEEAKNRIEKNKLTVVTQEGSVEKIAAYAHTSNSAVHIFLEESSIMKLIKLSAGLQGEDERFKRMLDRMDIRRSVRKLLTHEAGVMFGCPVLKVRDGIPVNEIDERVRNDAQGRPFIEPKKYKLVNLDHVKERDYAAGKNATDVTKLSIPKDALPSKQLQILYEGIVSALKKTPKRFRPSVKMVEDMGVKAIVVFHNGSERITVQGCDTNDAYKRTINDDVMGQPRERTVIIDISTVINAGFNRAGALCFVVKEGREWISYNIFSENGTGVRDLQLIFSPQPVAQAAKTGEDRLLRAAKDANEAPSILEAAKANIRAAAGMMQLHPDLLKLVLKPKKVTTVKFEVPMDNGEKITFWGFRVLQNDARGAGKGGTRWLVAKGETLEEAKNTAIGLATLMTIKNAVINIPYGGGKGDIFVPERKYTDDDKARIIRAFSRELTKENAIGPFIDVPAPDKGTDARMMAWFMDEYLEVLAEQESMYDKTIEAELKKITRARNPQETPYLDRYIKLLNDDKDGILQGFELGMTTGKPPLKGGSEGRAKATGFGGFLVLKAMLKHFAAVGDLSKDIIGRTLNNNVKAIFKKDLSEMTAAIQGAGNVGEYNAWELYKAGVKIHIFQDAVREGSEMIQYTLYSPDGLDIELLNKNLERLPDGRWAPFKTLSREFLTNTGYRLLRDDAAFFWKTHTNIKILAATENVITAENAPDVNCEIALELANTPTTPGADKILQKRGILVVPDVIANALGVTYSYYEWLQNIEGKYWTEGTVDKMAEERVNMEVMAVLDFSEKYQVGLREAAYVLSLARVVNAEIARDSALQKRFISEIPYKFYGELGLFPDTIEELNNIIKEGRFPQLVKESEKAKSREVDGIIRVMIEKFPPKENNFVLVTGPTTSGKLGLVVNLVDRLRAIGRNAIRLSFDNLTAEELKRLKYGEEIEVVDFVDGKKIARKIKPRAGDIYIVEGNLTLSDAVLSVIPQRNRFGIFVNTAPSMKLADNWPLTSMDLRLLRHILTLHYTEGNNAIDVIRQWPAERALQLQRVYPSWEKADMTCNGYLPYELPVIKFHVEEMLAVALLSAKKDNDEASVRIIERLQKTLKGVIAIDGRDLIPPNSIAQQYIGGESFYKGLKVEAADDVGSGTTSADSAAQDEITAAIQFAGVGGVDISTSRYNLLVTEQFFKNGELDAHRGKYGDRFDVDRVSGSTPEQFVTNILTKAAGKESRTVALVPNDLSKDHLEKLTSAGIRFVLTNVTKLAEARAEKDAYREKFQLDTYTVMLLTRAIDNTTDRSSPIYRLLSFYLKTHFTFAETIAIDDYIMAIAKNDIGKLIQGILAYRPAEAYDKPDYEKVAAALISA